MQPSNKRTFFRVSFDRMMATMQIIEVSGRPVRTEARSVLINDASGGGLCVTCNEDIPVRRSVVAIFEFSMGGQNFSFRGTFVRKLDDLRQFEYGVKFVDVDDRKQGELIGVLGRLQVERRKEAPGA